MSDTRLVSIEQIAAFCHEANRAYCEAINDTPQPTWDAAPKWLKESTQSGVRYALDYPHAPEGELHEAWVAEKIANGWTYGEIKSPAMKTHPNLRPYHELPVAQQAKDRLFRNIVMAFRSVM